MLDRLTATYARMTVMGERRTSILGGIMESPQLGSHLKAIFSALVSGIIAFLSSLLTALQGENTGFSTITDGQWVTAVLAFFVALVGTGAVTNQVRNRPPAASPPPAAPAPTATAVTG